MNRIASLIIIALIGCALSTGPARAGGSRAASPVALKTVAVVIAARDFVNKHPDDMPAVRRAIQSDPRFFDHKLGVYIFMHYYNPARKEAVCWGHGVKPELIGRNMWGLRTPNGRLLFQELVQLVDREGQGWLEYDWLNPFTGKIQTKRSYVIGVVLESGRKAWVGSGFWLD